MKKILSIAGTDCSGGAGMSADYKTITAHKMFAEGVITAVVAQNTTGVRAISECTSEMVSAQLDCVFEDIFPDAVKIGMVSSVPLIKIIAQKLRYYNAQKIVIDPVMVSTSGHKLLKDDAIECLTKELIPLASVITPNIPEAEVLSGINIKNVDDIIKAAELISKFFSGAILIKGGHNLNDANDFLYINNNESFWFNGKRIDNPNTHGTGCTLSAAIACNLAKDLSLPESIKNAKEYISGALGSMLDLGKGNGPLDHCFSIKEI